MIRTQIGTHSTGLRRRDTCEASDAELPLPQRRIAGTQGRHGMRADEHQLMTLNRQRGL